MKIIDGFSNIENKYLKQHRTQVMKKGIYYLHNCYSSLRTIYTIFI